MDTLKFTTHPDIYGMKIASMSISERFNNFGYYIIMKAINCILSRGKHNILHDRFKNKMEEIMIMELIHEI
jgi:hypothetical protein